MHPLQRTLLRAKHWELFSVWLVATLFSLMGEGAMRSHPSFAIPVLKKVGSLFLEEACTLLVVWPWAYSVGSFCNSIMPAWLRLRSAIFFLAVSGVLLVDFVYSWLSDSFFIGSWQLAIISLPALLCGAYVARFPAKTFVIAETRKPAMFWHYWGAFFGVVFFPIGIWFLQPHVNELYASYGESPAPPSVVHSAPNPT